MRITYLLAGVALEPVCDRPYYPLSVPIGARWDHTAKLIWESDDTDVIIGVECGLSRVGGSAVETLATRIDIRDPTARELRTFLTQHGAAVASGPAEL
jgi:hypothetical protein